MNYLGDFVEDTTVWFPWSTNDTSGGSITRAVDGTVKVRRSDGTVITTGITDNEDTPLTGMHECSIDLSAHADYATGYDYFVYVEGATIDGQTINANIASFSIENRYASEINFIKDVLEGDAKIDTTTTPWDLVIYKKGTSTELIRKKLKDVVGGNITEVTTVIGQQMES